MSLTKTREPKTKNLGELLGRFIEIEHRYDNLSEEMAAFGAPSECGTLAWRGRDRELEQLQDQIEKETGLTYKDLIEEAERRTTGKAIFDLHL